MTPEEIAEEIIDEFEPEEAEQSEAAATDAEIPWEEELGMAPAANPASTPAATPADTSDDPWAEELAPCPKKTRQSLPRCR